MPDTRPDTPFVDGVCQACINFENRKNVDWEGARRALEDIVAAARENSRDTGRRWDCVVASSGGKDSHYQVKTLLDLGARPLIVTATTCHLTTMGRRNIDNLARYATTIEVTPRRDVRRRLNAHALATVGDISWPEHALIFSVPFKVAQQHGIDLVFYGENPQREYGGPPGTEEARQMTRRWVTEFGGFLGLRPSDFVDAGVATQDEMADYEPATIFESDRCAPEALFLGAFIPWDSHRNAEVARAMGMEAARPTPANWWIEENQDNAQTGLHDHLMYRKYGYGRLATQISVDIRMGRIERERALKIVRTRDGLFPWQYMDVRIDDVIGPIGIDRSTLLEIMDRFTNWDIFTRNNLDPMARPILIGEEEGE